MIWRLYLCCMNEENNKKNEENDSTGSPRQDSGQAPQAESQTSELDKLKAERDEYLNGWKRAKADLINYQKEEAKRLEEIARFGTEDMVLDVISLLHNFNLGIASIEKAGGKVDSGFQIIKNQLEDLLRRRG